MKEVSLEDVLEIYFAEHETATGKELREYIDKKYMSKNIYVPFNRDEIDYLIEDRKLYYEKDGVYRKQEIMSCPVCGSKHLKHPDTQRWDFMKTFEHLIDVFKRIGT